MSGLPFRGLSLSLSLSLRFCSDVVLYVFFLPFLCFREKSSGSHRAHPTRTFLVCFLFPCFVPAALVLSPILAVRPLFWRFVGGAFLGPVHFCDFRILSELWGA